MNTPRVEETIYKDHLIRHEVVQLAHGKHGDRFTVYKPGEGPIIGQKSTLNEAKKLVDDEIAKTRPQT